MLNSSSGNAIGGADPAQNYIVGSGAILEFNRTGGTSGINRFNLSGSGTFKTSGTQEITQTSAGSTVAMGSGALFHVESGSYRFGGGGTGDWSANLSDLQVDSGATFNGAATPIVVNALNGSGTVKTGGGITVGIDNGSGSFSGIIENSSDGGSAFSITKGGSGTQTLSGANTYTGGTTLTGTGTLVLEDVNAAGTGSIIQTDANSILRFDTTGTITNSMTLYNFESLRNVTLSGDINAQDATYKIATGKDTISLWKYHRHG